MKSIGSLIASLTVVLAALLVIASPVSLRAAEAAYYSPRAAAAEPVKSAQECPLVHSAASAGCLSASRAPEPDTSLALHKVTSSYQQSSALDDSTGELLENLVKRGPDR